MKSKRIKRFLAVLLTVTTLTMQLPYERINARNVMDDILLNSEYETLQNVGISVPSDIEGVKEELAQYTSDYVSLEEKAEELGTPLAIYNYLKNNIDYEYYGGMRKGAEGTYDSLSGNDTDHAVLLTKMIEHIGYECRYVTGTIQLDAKRAEGMLGIADLSTAADIFAMSGLEVTLMHDESGTPLYIEMPHTWVEAYIPYTDYRGAENAGGEYMWVSLDTGIKRYEENPHTIYDECEKAGITYEAVSGITDADGMQDFFENVTDIAELLEHTQNNLYTKKRSIKQEELTYLPLSLQYKVSEITSRTEIPAAECDYITIALEGKTLAKLTSAELYNKRLTITYDGIEDNYAKAALNLDGKTIAEADAVQYSSTEHLSISVYSNGTTQYIENEIKAGGIYQITVDSQFITAREFYTAFANLTDACEKLNYYGVSKESILSGETTISDELAEKIYTDEYAGALLDLVGKAYFAQIDILDMFMAQQSEIETTRLLSIGMTGFMSENAAASLKDMKGMLYIDIDNDIRAAASRKCSEAEGKEDVQAYMLAAGLISSAYEHTIWEQITGVSSVSTIAVLNEAFSKGVKAEIITAGSIDNNSEKIHNLPQDVADDITKAVSEGKTVIIPLEETQILDWSGFGYIILDNSSFTGSYMISGGLNGGGVSIWADIAFMINLVLSAVDMYYAFGLIGTALAAGSTILGFAVLALVTVIVYFAAQCIMESYLNYLDAYSGDKQAEAELELDAALNVFITMLTSAGTKAVKKVVKNHAVKQIKEQVGEEIAEKLLKNGEDPVKLLKGIKILKNAGATDDTIKNALNVLIGDELEKFITIANHKFSDDILSGLVANKELLSKYSLFDLEFIMLNTAKSVDDIAGYASKYGDDFLRLFKLYGDDVLDILDKVGKDAVKDIDRYKYTFIDLMRYYGDDFTKLYKEYGSEIIETAANRTDEFFIMYDSYGDDFVKLAMESSTDVALEGVGRYGKDFIDGYAKYGYDYAELVLTYEDIGVQGISTYGDDFIKYYKTYGSTFIKYYAAYGDDIVYIYKVCQEDAEKVIEKCIESDVFNLNVIRIENRDSFRNTVKVILEEHKAKYEEIIDIKAYAAAFDTINTNNIRCAGCGTYRYNPTILDYNTKEHVLARCTTDKEFREYYKELLEDEYIDNMPAEWIKENGLSSDKASVKKEMKKLRDAIENTKAKAKELGFENKFEQPSFEKSWNVDNCAEIWAAREAILSGSRFDDLAFRSIDNKGVYKEPCKNCKITFFGHHLIE